MSQHHHTTRNMARLKQEFRDTCAQADTPCWMDGQPIDYTAPYDDWHNDNRFELDHYYPVSTHPQHEEDPANFRAAHAKCNRTRGNRPPTASLGTPSRTWT